jgi:hypothetical protein
VAGGSKYYPPASISKAFEVKYVKDMATPGGFDSDSEHVSTWQKVRSDVQKLVELQRVSQGVQTKSEIDPSARPHCHLVIVTHHDPFRCLPHRAEDPEETKTRDDSHGDQPPYPEQFAQLVQNCADLGIHVWHYHPAKVYCDNQIEYVTR